MRTGVLRVTVLMVCACGQGSSGLFSPATQDTGELGIATFEPVPAMAIESSSWIQANDVAQLFAVAREVLWPLARAAGPTARSSSPSSSSSSSSSSPSARFAPGSRPVGSPAATPGTAVSKIPVQVFLCAYGPWKGARCARGASASGKSKATLKADDVAVRAAASALRAQLPVSDFDPSKVRLKLDVVVSAAIRVLGTSVAVHDIGLVGFDLYTGSNARGETGSAGFVLPSELIERGVAKSRTGALRMKPLAAIFASRGHVGPRLTKNTPVRAMRTISWVEAEHQPLRLYRVHAYEAPMVATDDLLRRARAAAGYLARATGPKGRIRYNYDVVRARTGDDYNLLRHAGSIYALMQAYERMRTPAFARAARRAIRYLLSATQRGRRTGPYGGGSARYVVSPGDSGPKLKLGGSALALLALVQYHQATKDNRWRRQAQELATFLVAAQQKSGEFHSYLPLNPAGRGPSRVSVYYPGEAILALVRLYEWDGNKRWLAAARRGADWLIDVRDKGLAPSEMATDHWLMIGLSHLYRHTRDARYVRHSLAQADSILPAFAEGVAIGKRYRDYRGGFYTPARSTPAATRSEGLVAVLDTCALARQNCDARLQTLRTIVSHQLLMQYTPALLYWVAEPERARGGWMGGVTSPAIRNDFVQHNLSAILGMERHLRRPFEGGIERDRPADVGICKSDASGVGCETSPGSAGQSAPPRHH